MSTIEVLGFGALNMDQIYGVKRIVTDGETQVTNFTLSPGGSAANTIYGLAKLGVSTGFLGAVGDDDYGRRLLRDLESVGVDTGQIRIKTAQTGVAICIADTMGKRALYVLPGANSSLTGADMDISYISQARVLHLSSLANEGQFELQKELVSKIPHSVRVSFAPGSIYTAKGMKSLSQIIERTHILFLNQNEIEELTGEDFQRGARSCLELGCQIVAVTLGKGITRGAAAAVCYILSSDGEYMIQAKRPKRSQQGDTVGAGDAFAAGFLFGLLQGKGIQECGNLGQLMARLSLARIGARAGLPSLEQLRLGYKQLYYEPL